MENKKASLASYIKMDLYRGFFSTKFLIAFIGLCLSLLLGLLQSPKFYDVLDVFLFTINSITFLIVFIFCASTYGNSFSDDFENKYFRYSIIRGDINKYVLSKVIAITLTSIITMVLGVLLYTTILRCFLPWINSYGSSTYEEFLFSGKFKVLLSNKHFILYIIASSIQMGMYAAILSLIATYFSLFVSNKLLILTVPSIAYYILYELLPKTNNTTLVKTFISPTLFLKSTLINILVALGITIFSVMALYIAILYKISRRVQNE